ncbi:MAG: hypothetical protein NTZ86_01785 [Legionellales bacterium]|nr:hypothetical protein [Legionellales bacterium]
MTELKTKSNEEIGVLRKSCSSLVQPFTKPGAVLALVLLRYGLMPCAAYVIANSLALTTT